MNSTLVARIFRAWLACHFALVGFGLLLMVGVASASSFGSSRVPLGFSSMSTFYVLLMVVFVFAAIHVIALVSILKRNTRANLIAAGTCLLGLLLHASYTIVVRRMSQVDVAYSTLLGIELILLFVPTVRAEFGPRVKTA